MFRIRRPSPAMVVALLALFFSLVGTAAAAFVVSSNSEIGPDTIYGHKAPAGANKNIVAGSINGIDLASNIISTSTLKNGVVTPAKLAPESLARIDDLPDVLPRGQTIRGTFAINSHSDETGSAGRFGAAAISWGIPLASDPVLHAIKIGQTPPPECPGTVQEPAAAPGHLCVFEGTTDYGAPHTWRFCDPFNFFDMDGCDTRFGVIIEAEGVGNALWAVYGTWAVTGS